MVLITVGSCAHIEGSVSKSEWTGLKPSLVDVCLSYQDTGETY